VELQALLLSKTGPIGVIRTAMALGFAMMTPTGVAAEPQVLADSALDAVTAAGVLVDVSSVARAVGDHIVADTDAYSSIRTERLVEVGVGFSDGYAAACCGQESDVVLDSTALGAGDRVYSTTYTVEFRGATYAVDGGFTYFAYGYTGAFLLAISFEDGLEILRQTVQERRDEVRGVANVARELMDVSRDGFATGHELGGAISAGMRWQAAQDLVDGHWDARQLPSDTSMTSNKIK
jgi:hypothetical protein